MKAIRALLEDYCARDVWPVIEAETEERRPAIHVVVGGKSGSFSQADRARLDLDASRFSNISAHVLPNAGHNIHVDDPVGLLAIVTGAI